MLANCELVDQFLQFFNFYRYILVLQYFEKFNEPLEMQIVFNCQNR